MKVKLEMELADVLRISVLLDHHRREAAENAEGTGDGDGKSPMGILWRTWSSEAADLNGKLLKAVSTAKGAAQ